MPSIRFRPAFGVALVLATGLVTLPACKKKPDESAKSDGKSDEKNDQRSGSSWLSGSGSGSSSSGESGSPSTPMYSKENPPTATIRKSSQANLKNIIIAMHNFNDASNPRMTAYGLPVGIYDKSGKSLGLSWRVALLPYIGEDGLYREFKLDEPWDSAHNKKLISRIPKVYVAPGGDATGYTFYRSFTGPGTIMPPPKPGTPGKPALGLSLVAITDGASNTVAVAEAAKPVIWTKPDELHYDPKGPLPKLGGGIFEDGYFVGVCDGSVRWLPISGPPEAKLRAMITAQGGEVDLPF